MRVVLDTNVLFAAFITYGVCAIACWEYPDTVLVMLPAPASTFGAFGGPGDPWLQPPPAWQPKAGPPAPPPAAH